MSSNSLAAVAVAVAASGGGCWRAVAGRWRRVTGQEVVSEVVGDELRVRYLGEVSGVGCGGGPVRGQQVVVVVEVKVVVALVGDGLEWWVGER